MIGIHSPVEKPETPLPVIDESRFTTDGIISVQVNATKPETANPLIGRPSSLLKADLDPQRSISVTTEVKEGI